MADNLTKPQRHKNMVNIKSKWTKPELRLHNYLKGNRIKHKMHPFIDCNPDIILKDKKTAVFIHGCFWHKCSKCYKQPKINKKYWLPKIKRNVFRDKRNAKLLKLQGFNIIVL